MNKSELVVEAAKRSGLTQKAVATALDALLETVQEAVVAGDRVSVAGFGLMEPRHRKGRVGRNPQNGEVIDIPPAIVPTFKPGKLFKERMIRTSV